MKKQILTRLGIAVFAIAMLTGLITTYSKGKLIREEYTVAKDESIILTPSPTKEPKKEPYKGRNVMAVKKELEKEGYTLYYYNRQQGSMIAVDPSEIGSSEFPEYMLKEYYKVDKVAIDDAARTAGIYFYNTKADQEKKKKVTTTTNTFNADDVWWELEQRGDNAYPYGFKIHYLGSSEVRDGDGWIFTSKVTVTNAYGTKRETFLYATVSSTGSITSFEVY